MRRAILSILLCFPSVLALAPAAWGRDVTVTIASMEGPGKERGRLVGLQRELKRLRGVRVQTTSGFLDEAKKQRVTDLLPDDGRALSEVARALEVDAVVYGRLVRPDKRNWPRAKRSDRELQLVVYAGADGSVVGERTVRVRKGRLTRDTYKKAAKAIEADLQAAIDVPPPPPPVEREPEPMPVFDEPVPVTPRDDEPDEPSADTGDGPSMLQIHAGLALLSRTFDYTAAPDSAQFAEGGIQYESSTVPGIALDVEFLPLKLVTDGFARGFGLGLTYEKVFLSTQQAVQLSDGTTEDAKLETTHQHLWLRLLYRYAFGEAGRDPELVGHIGLGWLTFQLEDNDEYNGAAYQYLSLGVGGYVPLGTPYLALDARISVMPSVDLGDTAEELGDEVSAFGYRLYGGLASMLAGGLSIQAGLEWTSIGADITGAGRDGRIGESATDDYLGFRLMGGYRF